VIITGSLEDGGGLLAVGDFSVDVGFGGGPRSFLAVVKVPFVPLLLERGEGVHEHEIHQSKRSQATSSVVHPSHFLTPTLLLPLQS
jgi:hypothetical protein